MSRPVFDMNVFVEYKNLITNYHFSKMALSSVVLYELTATTIDKSVWEKYTAWRRFFETDNLFLVPISEDWWQSGRIASRIRHGEKSKAKGKTPKNPNTQKLQNDILIARSAFARKFFVVTSNLADFRKIQQFLNVEIVAAQDYFAATNEV